MMLQDDVKDVVVVQCRECARLARHFLVIGDSYCVGCGDWLAECDDAPFDRVRVEARVERWAQGAVGDL